MPTQPTQAQIKTWESFKAVAKRSDLEIRAAMLRFKQVQTLHRFLTERGMPIWFDVEQLAAEARFVYNRNERIKKCIEQVELGRFGLRFERGEIDIMAPPGTTSDEIAPYQFRGFPIIIIGAVVAYAIIEIIADQRQKAYDTYRKASNIVAHGDEQLCADPNSQQCRDWEAVKAENNFEEQNSNIGGLFDDAKEWPTTVKNWLKGAAGGLAIAAIAVAAFLLWSKRDAR